MTNLAKTNHFDPMLEGERKELTSPIETTHDMINDDTLADPEGAAARAEVAAYPDWALVDYEPSTTDFWGKAWNNAGTEHLVPKQVAVASVMDHHTQGMTTVKEMVAMAHQEQAETIKTLKDNYESILAGISDDMKYPVMKGIANAVQTALAERAYAKHLFVNAYGSVRDPDQELPDFVAKRQDKVFESAIKAGVWYDVHQHCWNYVQYKGSPKYYVENDVKFRLINAAKYIDEQYREVKAATAPAREYVQTTLAC
jgi:hypothetical protein